MKTEPTHTPTPWRVAETKTRFAVSAVDSDICRMEGKKHDGVSGPNAAFIVRAVNTHEDLLACLKHEMQSYSPRVAAILSPEEIAWKEQALKVIAKAEERGN